MQEIVVSRGRVLELLRPDEAGRLQVVFSTDVFGIIRALQPFRFPGSQQDYVIAASDSGRVVILQYSKDKGTFLKLHQETFGRSGVRRIVPGQYLAADPKGRACLIGAIEKQKFVYVLNRDAEARLTISSPLEAHKNNTICFAITALDVGFDNPMFAAIELNYTETDEDPTGEAIQEAEKHLTLYELDLGLNHVVKRYSQPIDRGSNMLLAVPGGGDGPGGVLICAENYIIWHAEDQQEVRTIVPRRHSLPAAKTVLITAAATHKQKNLFFMLIQSEYGDLYKVTMEYSGETVTELKCKYFDTIPPATSLCVMRKGFLFAGSEAGDHGLYAFQSLGDDDNSVETSSAIMAATTREDGGGGGGGSRSECIPPVFFDPRELKNLEMIDKVGNLGPLIDMKVANLLGEEVPQIYATCGRGARSTLRMLRAGVAVSEIAVSTLPGAPIGIWSLKKGNTDIYDGYIIVSFANATLVLSVGETVQEVTDSGFDTDTSTLTAQLLADDSLLQVTRGGLRHIRPDGRVQEWKVPGKRAISTVACNARQVALALGGGELIYFELNMQGLLVEVEKKDLGSEVASVDIGTVPEGRQRFRFLAVGLHDGTVRILSLDPADTLSTLSTQAVAATPDSLLLLEGGVRGAQQDAGNTTTTSGVGALFLQVGLSNGILLRTEVDMVLGTLSDTRQRFLGTRSPKLVACTVRGCRAMLALSSRPWLGYSEGGKYILTPFSYDALDSAASFSSEQCHEGFVAVARNSLRVLSLERVGEFFNQKVMRLRYTPRKMAIHPEFETLLVAEADVQAIPLVERQDLQGLMKQQEQEREGGEGNGNDHGNGDGGVDGMEEDGAEAPSSSLKGPEEDELLGEHVERLGSPVGEPGAWASCIRIVDPSTLTTTHCIEMDNNEGALCITTVSFDSAPHLGTLLAVGTAQSLSFYPKSCLGGFIRLYQFTANGKKMSLLHKTAVDDVPGALIAFKGRLLAGIGDTLKLFDLGKLRLLRKCEYKRVPSRIATLDVLGSRVYVGDGQESFFFFKYRSADNTFFCYADDTVPRHLTAALNLDPNTMVGADRFGNIAVVRLPEEASAVLTSDPTGGKFAEKGASGAARLGSAPLRLGAECNFHLGEMVTALEKCVLQPGGREVVLYGTIHGTIGTLVPLTSREDADFFQHLEMHMRAEGPPLLGRDHQAFRSAYFPVRDVLDGDLCEQYVMLSDKRARALAGELERTPGEVLKKLEEVRNRII